VVAIAEPTQERRHKTKADLAVPEIRFIPNDDFRTASEDEFAQIDEDLYVTEEERNSTAGDAASAQTFHSAVDSSRLLTFEGEQLLFKRLNFLRFRANAIQVSLPQRRPPKKKLKEISRLLAEADSTREEIARANLRLVMSIARKHSSCEDQCDEFVAEANGILLYAIDKFDFSRGYRFSTYATHAIQRHLFRLVSRVQKRSQRETTESSAPESATSGDVRTDEPTAGDYLTAANSIVSRMSEVLDERETAIVVGRFGLDESGKSHSLREIGEQLGISKERVRQLLQQSVTKLAVIAEPFESTFAADDGCGGPR